jgi:hypothetical protein
MVCKGVCCRYKASKPHGVGRYAIGQKRCQICVAWMNWEGLWCPCCGYRVRTKPRNIVYKTKLREFEAEKLNQAKLAKKEERLKKSRPKTE